MLPVRLKAAEQDQQLKGLTIAKEMKSREDILKADFAAHQLGPTLSNLYQAGKPEEAMNLLLSEVAKNRIRKVLDAPEIKEAERA